MIKLIQIVRDKSLEDLEKNPFGMNPMWRLHTLELVSYHELVIKFWIPLKPENFWKDTSFLK
jgi:hypothetical protein